MKDDKFAAEPTADATADAKVHHGVVNATTTESVSQSEDETKKEDKKTRKPRATDEDKVYEAYVKGERISDIADRFKVDSQVVLGVINTVEQNRKLENKVKG